MSKGKTIAAIHCAVLFAVWMDASHRPGMRILTREALSEVSTCPDLALAPTVFIFIAITWVQVENVKVYVMVYKLILA